MTQQTQSNGAAEMPRYRSHKVVWALKIKKLDISPVDGSMILHPEEPGYSAIRLSDNWFQKHSPHEGGYYVAYADGYTSFSPAKAFEEGYTRTAGNMTTCMTFGQAIESLKAGKRVAREGWNGKGMWISLSGDGPREISADKFWSANNAQYAQGRGGAATVLPCITMKTATGEILMGWLASQTDILAEDWSEV